MRFEDSLQSELTAIKLFLKEVPTFLAGKAQTANQARDVEGSLGYGAAIAVALDGVVHLLNAAVDGSLLILANRLCGVSISARDMLRHRTTLITELEGELGVKLAELPGWDQVEALCNEANALKHRTGLAFTKGEKTPLKVMLSVDPTPTQLLERCAGIRTWLLEIHRRVEARLPKDVA